MSARSPVTAVLMVVFATTVLAVEESRPRIMHAEMVTAGDQKPARSVKVSDASPARPRMFEMPAIDKSKVEDPYKTAPPPAPSAKSPPSAQPAKSAATAPAPRPASPVVPSPPARSVLKMPELATAQELSRQQREMMLATSGPSKPVRKTKAETETVDYSHVHWSYSGLGAPENWPKLPGGRMCGSGMRQSPIDIRGGIRVDLEQIGFQYRPTLFRITDNGHTVQVDVAEGNNIGIMGRDWQLVHIHFHRPSEERVNGKTYEMSAHLVHRDYANNLAVITILMERGTEHPVIQTLWNHMPLDTGMSVEPPNVPIDLVSLLPERREYYTYMGSLTTPPCTENVLWMVFKEPIRVSPEQIGIFARLYPDNARPVQPTHDRLIKESR